MASEERKHRPRYGGGWDSDESESEPETIEHTSPSASPVAATKTSVQDSSSFVASEDEADVVPPAIPAGVGLPPIVSVPKLEEYTPSDEEEAVATSEPTVREAVQHVPSVDQADEAYETDEGDGKITDHSLTEQQPENDEEEEEEEHVSHDYLARPDSEMYHSDVHSAASDGRSSRLYNKSLNESSGSLSTGSVAISQSTYNKFDAASGQQQSRYDDDDSYENDVESDAFSFGRSVKSQEGGHDYDDNYDTSNDVTPPEPLRIGRPRDEPFDPSQYDNDSTTNPDTSFENDDSVEADVFQQDATRDAADDEEEEENYDEFDDKADNATIALDDKFRNKFLSGNSIMTVKPSYMKKDSQPVDEKMRNLSIAESTGTVGTSETLDTLDTKESGDSTLAPESQQIAVDKTRKKIPTRIPSEGLKSQNLPSIKYLYHFDKSDGTKETQEQRLRNLAVDRKEQSGFDSGLKSWLEFVSQKQNVVSNKKLGPEASSFTSSAKNDPIKFNRGVGELLSDNIGAGADGIKYTFKSWKTKLFKDKN